nr:MAG TPA: hypothetical protein [Caudoviricetes sp.]
MIQVNNLLSFDKLSCRSILFEVFHVLFLYHYP